MNLLKEWNEKQFKTVEKAAANYLKSRWFETLHGGKDKTPFVGCETFEDFDRHLGTAYTSTGDYAGLWVCNTELYLDVERKFHLIGFALGSGGFVFSIWWDNEENEIIFPIN